MAESWKHHEGKSELFVAAVMVTIFGIMTATALQYPKDARLFPMIIGTAGLALSLGVLLQAVRFHHSESSAFPARERPATPRRHRIALSAAPAYGVLLWLAGFYVASAVALVALPYGFGYRKPARLLLLMAVSILLMRILFASVMGIQMPQGLLGQWVLETFIYED